MAYYKCECGAKHDLNDQYQSGRPCFRCGRAIPENVEDFERDEKRGQEIGEHYSGELIR